jgi:integral membrane sensor domain MASE1
VKDRVRDRLGDRQQDGVGVDVGGVEELLESAARERGALRLGSKREGQWIVDSYLRGCAPTAPNPMGVRLKKPARPSAGRDTGAMLEEVAGAAPRSPPRRTDADRRLYAAQIVCLAAIYYGAAKLGLSLAFSSPSVTAVWPPTGIALAALVLWGYRLWPGVALGAFLANSWTGVPLYAVAGIALGNTLEALAGAYLLRRFAGFRPSLERVRDVIALAALAAILSTTVSATIGVASIVLGNEVSASSFGSAWRTWWLGDMGGDLVVATAVMVAVTHWPFRRAPGRLLEALAAGAVIAAITAVAFSERNLLPYLIFPPLIWAALRFWQPGAVGATLLIASIAIPLTENNMGPFANHTPDDRLLLAQTFIAVAGVTALVLAAVTTERRRVEDADRYIAETLQRGLLPAHLPDIPGLEAAVEFRPVGARQLVGGDFYDWFETTPGTWDVLVGDVTGKGAAAARTTALARYTLRANAVDEQRPSRILKLLNEALIRQAPGETCTVAYVRLALGRGRGAVATIAAGGHPLPLVLRSDGRVEEVGAAGALLGVVPDPALTERTARLAAGDALVLYTDGLTGAGAPERIVAPEELMAAVSTLAGRNAHEIVAGIRARLIDDGAGEARDDVVILAVRVPS